MKTKQQIAEILSQEFAKLGCNDCKYRFVQNEPIDLICNRCEDFKLVYWKLSDEKALEIAEKILE